MARQDTQERLPRHFGTFNGEEIVILGYKKALNEMLVVRMAYLPKAEQEKLRAIANAWDSQQNRDYLINVLEQETYSGSATWAQYLLTRLQKRDKAMLTVGVDRVANMNAEQKAFFKGYGTALEAKNKTVNAEQPADVELPETAPVQRETGISTNDILAALMKTQNKMLETLERMEKNNQPAPKNKGGRPKKKVVLNETPTQIPSV